MDIPDDPPVSERNNSSSKTTNMSSGYQDITTGKDSSLSKSNMGSTIHYMSPASLSIKSLYAEDDRMPDYGDFFRYFSGPLSVSGEYSYVSGKSSVTLEIPQMERTLAIIKPEAMFYKDVVLRKIQTAGFQIIQQRTIHLTPEQVSDLYAKHYGEPSFPFLVVSMSSEPVLIMCLAAIDAVKKWKKMVTPTRNIHHSWFNPRSMRRFGKLGTIHNVLHASETVASAKKEIRYFFPGIILEPLLRNEQLEDYLAIYVNPTLLDALVELCKRKPVEPLLFFADWLLLNNPYQPKTIPKIAKLPT